jgi:predicted nucleotidyltransferase
MNIDVITAHLKQRLPDLQAAYLFGSYASGEAGPQSDLDLAVLLPRSADPVFIWELSCELADLAGVPVDLVDLRSASTVMQYQVITTGQRLWGQPLMAGLFECFVLSEKTALDTARSGLLADIKRDGHVYAR